MVGKNLLPFQPTTPDRPECLHWKTLIHYRVAFDMTRKPSTAAGTATSSNTKPETTQNEATAAPRLSLKLKGGTPASPEVAGKTLTRSRKKVIRRDELPADKLSNTKAPSKPKSKNKPKAATQKKPSLSPSDVRLRNLDNELCAAFEVWTEFRPLVIGVEKEVNRFISDNHVSASKRVVQRLLRQHTQDERYQHNLKAGVGRYQLGAEIK